jgi:ADP-ribosylglycohydrolase
MLESACNSFTSKCQSVQYLALSMQEPEEDYQEMCNRYGKKFKQFNLSPADRNWNWKDKDYTYSRTRTEDKPGYVGSYCMDALAMALHTVYYTNSFREVALLNANMGGDCDTVGAIAGQIAGAMYGIDRDILKLYSEMDDFRSGRYEVFLKAYKMAKRL